MKVYYAHCKSLYNTQQEKRDINTLWGMGFEVVNPNLPIHEEECKKFPKQMDYFKALVRTCRVLAFRSLVDGSISAGVMREIEEAQRMGIPVIELPTFHYRRVLDVNETRVYLKEVGER